MERKSDLATFKFYNETLTIYAILKIVSERLFFLPKNPPSKAQCRKQRNAFLFDTNIICWLHDTGVNTVDDQKPFLVVGMIFSDVILGQKFVMIIGKENFLLV